MITFKKDKQFVKFCAYGFLKNLRFYDAFLLLFFLENGVSYSQIGILYAVREITINVAEIPSGIMADTYGRKNALIAAFFVYILSFLVFYFSKDFNLLLIAMLLYGIADAFRSGTHKGMIMDYLKLNQWSDQKVAYYGHTRSWSQKGSAISAIFAGFLVFYAGNYRIIYLMSIIPYLLNFMNIATYPKEINHSLSGKKKQKEKSLLAVFKNFQKNVRNKKVFQIINSAALHSAFLKAIKDYIQPIMVSIAALLPILVTLGEKRKSGLIIGILYFFIFLMTSFASKNAFKITSKSYQGHGFKNLSKSTLLLGLSAGVLGGLLIHFEVWIISLFLFVVIYLVENVRKPILTGTLSDNVPNEILTSVLSAQSFYSTIITSLLAVLLGVFADIFGIGISLLAVSSILILLIVVVGNPEPYKAFKNR